VPTVDPFAGELTTTVANAGHEMKRDSKKKRRKIFIKKILVVMSRTAPEFYKGRQIDGDAGRQKRKAIVRIAKR